MADGDDKDKIIDEDNNHEIAPGPRVKIGVSQAIDAIGFGKYQVLIATAVGCAWIADAMEMMILSILSPALHCSSWHISDYQQAFLTTFVFIGKTFFLCNPSIENISA